MKNTAKTFIKVGRILEILLLALSVLLTVIAIIVFIVGGIEMAAAEGDADLEALAGATLAAGGSLIGASIPMFICALAGLIILGIGSKKVGEAKCKACARTGAILLIVAGVVGWTVFPAVAGVFYLVMREEVFQSDIEGKCECAEAAPVEEIAEAKVVEEEPVVEAKEAE